MADKRDAYTGMSFMAAIVVALDEIDVYPVNLQWDCYSGIWVHLATPGDFAAARTHLDLTQAAPFGSVRAPVLKATGTYKNIKVTVFGPALGP
jgi:hypothetical protein